MQKHWGAMTPLEIVHFSQVCHSKGGLPGCLGLIYQNWNPEFGSGPINMT